MEKQRYCIIAVNTEEALEKAIYHGVSAVFVDAFMLDDEVEREIENSGYRSGLVGWTGKLFLRRNFDVKKYDLVEALESLGVRSENLLEGGKR